MQLTDAYRIGVRVADVHRGEFYLFDVGSGAKRKMIEANIKYDTFLLNSHFIRAVF